MYYSILFGLYWYNERSIHCSYIPMTCEIVPNWCHVTNFRASRDELMSRMKAELQDKDARLTDAQLQALATKHQMEQLKLLLISMKVHL